MSKVFDVSIIFDPTRIDKESKIVSRMGRVIKNFDAYEKRERREKLDKRYEEYCMCMLCPDDQFNWHPKDDLYEDDEHGWLCRGCLADVEREREAEAEVRIIEDNEKKFHDKGGI